MRKLLLDAQSSLTIYKRKLLQVRGSDKEGGHGENKVTDVQSMCEHGLIFMFIIVKLFSRVKSTELTRQIIVQPQ